MVGRIPAQAIQNLLFVTSDPKLDGLFAKHGDQVLTLKRCELGMTPRERCVVRYVHERQRIAPMGLTRRAHRDPSGFSKGVALLVAGGAGLGVVGRQTGVKEQIASKLNLFQGHGIVRRYRWRREPWGQLP